MKVNMKAVRNGRGLVERAACLRLAELAAEVPRRQAIVELGAYCGRSTGYLVAGSRGAHVWSIDPWDEIAGDAVSDEYARNEPNYRNGKYLDGGAQWKAHIAACGITRQMVTAHRATGLEVAAGWAMPSVGLLFHDAVHSYEAVTADLTAWLPHMAWRSTVALHDLGNAAFGVEQAAIDVLGPAGFDIEGRERLLWRKAIDRRGLLVVHRR